MNDEYDALQAMEKLERNPSEPISDYLKAGIARWKTSSELKEHIKHTEKLVASMEMFVFGVSALFFFSLILRIIMGITFRIYSRA